MPEYRRPYKRRLSGQSVLWETKAENKKVLTRRRGENFTSSML